MKIKMQEISTTLHNDYSLFICSSSFEARWFSAIANLSDNYFNTSIVLHKGCEELNWADGYNHLLRTTINQPKILNIKYYSPSDLWDTYTKDVLIECQNTDKKILVDITTFTHESLLILTYMLYVTNTLDKSTFIYSSAGEYFIGPDKNDRWLSRGVKSIRSVLGFPGLIRPSKSSHLIILVGFKIERAKELITQYEPSSISLGIGVSPYSDEFSKKNIEYRSLLENFIRNYESSRMEISEFTFSCSDPLIAKKNILDEVEKFNEKNITISPMNTKVSTVATALAAITNESIKICYAEPVEYNQLGYSSPGDSLTIMNLSELLEEKQ